MENGTDLPRRLKIALIAVIATGVLWRLFRYLLQMPVWGDEAMLCVQFFDRSYAGLARPLLYGQVSPLLFLWSEFTMFKIAGGHELSLRFLPVIAGITAIFVFRRFARFAAGSAVVALLATAILAVSYYPARHSCEIKPYAFDLLASVILLALAAEWLQRPEHSLPKLLLALFVPVAVAMSYPAVFVAGGISLALLPQMLRKPDWRNRLWFLLFNLLLVSAFLVCFRAVAKGQIDETSKVLTAYWAAAFPPATPWAFVKWLASIHTGNMFAYPVGGRHGGSTASFLLACLGVWEMIRRRVYSLLTLLLAPFVLTFIAAALHRYPYGESARVAQHLAPAICLLMATGLASLLMFKAKNEKDGKNGENVKTVENRVVIACCILAAIGVGGIIRDIVKPYKTTGDKRVRQIVLDIFKRAGAKDQIVIFNHRETAVANFQWYLRLRAPRPAWDDRIDIDQLRTTGGDVWWMSFTPQSGRSEGLPERLSQTGRNYRLLNRSEEKLWIGTGETPPIDSVVEHWAAETKF